MKNRIIQNSLSVSIYTLPGGHLLSGSGKSPLLRPPSELTPPTSTAEKVPKSGMRSVDAGGTNRTNSRADEARTESSPLRDGASMGLRNDGIHSGRTGTLANKRMHPQIAWIDLAGEYRRRIAPKATAESVIGRHTPVNCKARSHCEMTLIGSNSLILMCRSRSCWGHFALVANRTPPT